MVQQAIVTSLFMSYCKKLAA